MVADTLNALGGLGLFLLGMVWLTDGLRGLSGRALRNAIARSTTTPLSGVITGALTTAVVQSSSATTVTAVGFVNAGLLTFHEALGIIFGANIGTTLTGWLVAVLGFKLNLGTVSLPLVFMGALLRIFGGPRISLLGTALSGFALLFVGIEAMKSGMSGFEGMVTPQDFPDDSLMGRLQLVLIGVAVTVITQSSSAGVATALAALTAGAITLPQAAAMVIGMDVGTTFTAFLATIGGSTATRRTGLSHVIYNVITGIVAFLLLTPFATYVAPHIQGGSGEFALVAFHTGFNLLGIVLILPFTRSFARLVETIVPEPTDRLTRHLGRKPTDDPEAAIDAAAGAITDIYKAECDYLESRLQAFERTKEEVGQRLQIGTAIKDLRIFVAKIPTDPSTGARADRLASVVHALDHLHRLFARYRQDPRIDALQEDHRLRRLGGLLGKFAGKTPDLDGQTAERNLNRLRRLLRRQRHVYRNHLIELASLGEIDHETVAIRLDAMRWLHRTSYHLWRIQYHSNRLVSGGRTSSGGIEAALDEIQ